MSFSTYLLGIEQNKYRRMLLDMGVPHGGFSYWSAHKRMPKKRELPIAEWGFRGVFLDSGGHTANSDPGKLTQGEWKEYAAGYVDFALAHVDQLDMISEFDCLALGLPWIEAFRREQWSEIPVEKFLPVWHAEHGIKVLEEMGERYARIAVSQDDIAQPGLNVTPLLNKLANKGVLLHGLAMPRPDAVRHVKFATISSNSWLSPARYGESQIFDGQRLVRYPAKMKNQARTRHRAQIEAAGFDFEKVKNDDSDEVTRLAIWSWMQMAGEGVSPTERNEGELDAETDQDAVGTDVVPVRKPRATPKVPNARATTPLPVFGYTEVEKMDTDSDAMIRYSLPVLNSAPMRQCNNCFVREECFAFEEDAACTFTIPIELRTPDQRKAFTTALIEFQAQRLAFMRFQEEARGGYADPNVSQEFDRLIKAIQVIAEIEDERDFFRMTVESKGKAGVLSRLFGQDAAERADTGPQLGAADTDRLLGRVLKGEIE